MMSSQPERGLQKSGYLEIKQSSKVKNRKLKSWKRRWIVVHQMSDLASGTYAAKVDVYNDQETASRSRGDKQTFFLEHVTGVQHATSKTHPHAFEIVESEPVLVFCGANGQETLEWMNTFKKIFFPDNGEYGRYEVSILPNNHSIRLSLEGKYILTVTTSDVMLQTTDNNTVIKWNLSSLKKFYLDSEPNANQRKVIVIESGPNSYTGEGVFRFLSGRAETILEAIRLCIKEAIAEKQKQRSLTSPDQSRERTVSFTASERNFKFLLDDSRHLGEIKEGRAESVLSSSSSTSSQPCSPFALPGQSPPPLPGQTESVNRQSNAPHFPAHLSEETLGKIHKNASVPNMAAYLNDNGYSHIPEKSEPLSKLRTMSLTSRDSGVVFPDAEGKSPTERVRKTSVEKRCFSNSFDSAVSSGSSEESRRKFSDVENAITEESSPVPIYNDIDDKGVSSDSKNKTADDKPRRHSTGDFKKENEYEDLEKFRNGKDASTPDVKIPDEPPALPERPPKLLLRHSTKEESLLKRTGSDSKTLRHSCIGKFDPGRRRSSSAEVIQETIGSSTMSRSSSKDLYASIPDIQTKCVTEVIPIRENSKEGSTLDANQVCLDIFSPSVGDWVLTTGTPPTHGDQVPPPVPPPNEPLVDDLLGLSDFVSSPPLIDISGTEDQTVTKPGDLLLGFDPFESNSVNNDLLIQGEDWSSAPQSGLDPGQENPYIDMTVNRQAELDREEEVIYVSPNKE